MGKATEQLRPIAELLERFLCPGGKMRLSPILEAVQCEMLLGARPDPRRHEQSLREVVHHPEQAHKFEAIAQRLLCSPEVSETEEFFTERESLDLYLAHYFPANAVKLQLVLLDLLRAGQLPETLHLVDLGIGPGTTFLAVLDFVLALGAIADLVGVPLPIQGLSLRGYDCAPVCISYTAEVLDVLRSNLVAYCEHFPPLQTPGVGPALQSAWILVEKALEEIPLTRCNLTGERLQPFPTPTLAVLSYTLTHLQRNQRDLGAFESQLARLPSGSVLIVLEPGRHENAVQLMRWRRSLLARQKNWTSVLPCGQEFGNTLPAVCDTCWCARREDVHLSAFQRACRTAFLAGLRLLSQRRQQEIRKQFDRLSWSFCVLARGSEEPQATSTIQPATLQRYIGNRCGPSKEETKLAFCPARAVAIASPCTTATLDLKPGKVLPPVRFGELVELENSHVETSRGAASFILTRNSRLRPVQSSPPICHLDPSPSTLDALAQRLFGFTVLHNFQHKIIRRILAGKHTLGIAATAAGKTECFLLPAMLLPGITVVVSPLKSLMQDQVSRCQDRYGLDGLTTYLNGDVPYGERLRRLREIREGHYKVAYFTPEQLARHFVRVFLKQTQVSVLAIDEAHCVSQWGHDFRPDYLNMVRRLRPIWAQAPTLIALTATAGERVRRDLCDAALFDLDNRPIEEGGDVVYHPSNRAELELVVRVEPTAEHRSNSILRELQPFTSTTTKGSAVVFMPHVGRAVPEPMACAPGVEPFAGWLETQLQQQVCIYHGQMNADIEEYACLAEVRVRRGDWGTYLFERTGENFVGVGILHDPTPGAWYRLVGRWNIHEKYGRQFVFQQAAAAEQTEPKPQFLGDVTGRNRSEEQIAFMRSQRRIMVATKSFGMGIDKPDIRLVIHHSPPGDLLSYAQEVGRGARDGQVGRVVLYFTEGLYSTAQGNALSDLHIQSTFIAGRYVRECDLRACIAFLRTWQKRLHVCDEGIERTYAVFSFLEIAEYLDSLAMNPMRAGLQQPYHWPDNAEPQKVVGLTLEVLFKTIVRTPSGQAISLLESCQEVFACVQQPAKLNWAALEDSNAEMLREMLARTALGEETLRQFCSEAGPLFPLAQDLGCTIEDAVGFLQEAAQLGIVSPLRLGNSSDSSDVRTWEVCLSALLLTADDLDSTISTVVQEHHRRREEDARDWNLMLSEYVGIAAGQPSVRRCLRQVLLAFLDTGEDVLDGWCGACSSCCPQGDYLPLAERAGRIITIPAEFWFSLQKIRQGLDALPDLAHFQRICSGLALESGATWRRAVYLNTQRLLHEDRDALGATALLLCLVGRGWVERDEHEIDRLFQTLWQHRAAGRLAGVAQLMVGASDESALLAHWRARLIHEEDPVAALPWWQKVCETPRATRTQLHQAATTLAASGQQQFARLAARTSPNTAAACAAYGACADLDLHSPDAVQTEATAILNAVGDDSSRGETYVGLLLAARNCGASAATLTAVLDAEWRRLVRVLSGSVLEILPEVLGEPVANDSRWRSRIFGILADDQGSALWELALQWCGDYLRMGGEVAEAETLSILRVVSHPGLAQWMPVAVFQHVWDWAWFGRRCEVVRALLDLEIAVGARGVRDRLVQETMTQLLHARPTRWQRIAKALDALVSLKCEGHPETMESLIDQAQRCPIHAAALLAWLEHRWTLDAGSAAAREDLVAACVRFGLDQRAAAVAAETPLVPARHRVRLGWLRADWDDTLFAEFLSLLGKLESSGIGLGA